MKLKLISNDPTTIKRMRSIFRRRIGHSRITIRNGQTYTMRYNPGRQPRTECQEKSWSLFKEANARVAADFANPDKKAYWVQRQRQQSHYKTARGLARAYYMQSLKEAVSRRKQDMASSTRLAIMSLHISTINNSHHASPSLASHHLIQRASHSSISWTHHRNIQWWQASLHDALTT